MLRYSTAINHYTVLNLTKLDVLDTLPDIKVAVAYKLEGKEVPFPDNATDLQKVEVVYETLPGWMQSIQGVRTFEELPENARKYVEYVESGIGVKIKWIGSVVFKSFGCPTSSESHADVYYLGLEQEGTA